jgi:CheY-like chemotaxis protein
VLVVTVTSKEQKARALGADEFWLKPVDRERLPNVILLDFLLRDRTAFDVLDELEADPRMARRSRRRRPSPLASTSTW